MKEQKKGTHKHTTNKKKTMDNQREKEKIREENITNAHRQPIILNRVLIIWFGACPNTVFVICSSYRLKCYSFRCSCIFSLSVFFFNFIFFSLLQFSSQLLVNVIQFCTTTNEYGFAIDCALFQSKCIRKLQHKWKW